jgi:hypothetical protein
MCGWTDDPSFQTAVITGSVPVAFGLSWCACPSTFGNKARARLPCVSQPIGAVREGLLYPEVQFWTSLADLAVKCSERTASGLGHRPEILAFRRHGNRPKTAETLADPGCSMIV